MPFVRKKNLAAEQPYGHIRWKSPWVPKISQNQPIINHSYMILLYPFCYSMELWGRKFDNFDIKASRVSGDSHHVSSWLWRIHLDRGESPTGRGLRWSRWALCHGGGHGCSHAALPGDCLGSPTWDDWEGEMKPIWGSQLLRSWVYHGYIMGISWDTGILDDFMPIKSHHDFLSSKASASSETWSNDLNRSHVMGQLGRYLNIMQPFFATYSFQAIKQLSPCRTLPSYHRPCKGLRMGPPLPVERTPELSSTVSPWKSCPGWIWSWSWKANEPFYHSNQSIMRIPHWPSDNLL